MKTFLFSTILTIIASTAFSQVVIINGKEENRNLVWADFTGKPDKSEPHFAYTYWNISYKMDNVRESGDSVILDNFRVIVELDPKKSWAKKDNLTDELLVHEQGHFDLGILCMNEIAALAKQTKLQKHNFSYTIQNIMGKTISKYSALMSKYDFETNHSKNKEQQKKWNQFFAESK